MREEVTVQTQVELTQTLLFVRIEKVTQMWAFRSTLEQCRSGKFTGFSGHKKAENVNSKNRFDNHFWSSLILNSGA